MAERVLVADENIGEAILGGVRQRGASEQATLGLARGLVLSTLNVVPPQTVLSDLAKFVGRLGNLHSYYLQFAFAQLKRSR